MPVIVVFGYLSPTMVDTCVSACSCFSHQGLQGLNSGGSLCINTEHRQAQGLQPRTRVAQNPFGAQWDGKENGPVVGWKANLRSETGCNGWPHSQRCCRPTRL